MNTPEAREERRINAMLDAEMIRRLDEHMKLEDERAASGGHWHMGKEVPIAIIVAIIVQTAGVIWWAASTAAKVEFIKEAGIAAQMVQTTVDRKQDDDARKSEDRIMSQLEKVDRKLDRLIETKK